MGSNFICDAVVITFITNETISIVENAVAMAAKLKAAGFDTFITTEKGTAVTVKKSVQEIAREVVAGKWDNGEERKKKLIAAGYDYGAVQAAVNALMG